MGNKGTRRVSLADVARHAGTSHSAASRTLNGRPGVRQDIREAVLAAAKDLGYIPNTSARNLVMQRTGLVALVFTHPSVLVGTRYFSELVANIVSHLDVAGYRTVLLLPDTSRERSLGDVVWPGAFDGAVIIGHRTGDGVVSRFIDNGIPTVLLGRPVEAQSASFVDVDNVGAAVMATEHLLTSGAAHPAMIACSLDTGWGADRLSGFTKALQARGHASPEVEVCEWSASGAYEGMSRLLERAPSTDAVLIASEVLVPGVQAALDDAARSSSQVVALTAFNEEPARAYPSRPLTSVCQPLATMGAELARFVTRMIAEPTTRLTAVFECTLDEGKGVSASSDPVSSR